MEKGTKEEKEKGNVNSKPNPTPFFKGVLGNLAYHPELVEG